MENGNKPCNSSAGNLGLTKREYIAAKAMQGILSNSNAEYIIRNSVDPESVAKAVIDYTDAVLKELDK